MHNDPIFEPLWLGTLEVKNRIFRSNVTGRFDNYDGSGTQARINWEARFARGGVGAIISSFVPVHVSGRVQPNYAHIDDDDKIPFWQAVGEAVHRFDCKFILQLSHSGRQRDLPGVENHMRPAWTSTDQQDWFHGLLSKAMTPEEIQQVVAMFAAGARRARISGLDGIELHATHGYLFTQFLSPAINDRKDQYGGSLENRARFLMEVVRAIRHEVGRDYPLGVKINAVDFEDAVYPCRPAGAGLEESVQVCRWLEESGVDYLHISVGTIFPHPLLPPGGFPLDEANWWYGIMGSSGTRAYVNYAAFHFRKLRPVFHRLWNHFKSQRPLEGVSAEYAREIKRNVQLPVISTGGYQDARLIRHVISQGWVDAVSIARPLIANPDLPNIIKSGKDLPDSPCSFCNRCLLNAIYNPLACYDLRRFGGDYAEMIRRAMEVFDPPGTYVTNVPVPRVKPKGLYMLPPYSVPLGNRTDPISFGEPILPHGIRELNDRVRDNAVDVVQLRWRRLLEVGLVTIALIVAACLLWVL